MQIERAKGQDGNLCHQERRILEVGAVLSTDFCETLKSFANIRVRFALRVVWEIKHHYGQGLQGDDPSPNDTHANRVFLN